MQSRSAVAIIGGGKMGGDIAAVFAAGEWDVHVVEPQAATRSTLGKRTAGALRALHAAKSRSKRIHAHAALDALPWPRISLVVEAVPEELALKQRLFRALEALAPREAILTTNSSSLRLADVSKGLRHKDRTAGVHWLTPASIAPVVEVVRGKSTSPATIRQLHDWLTALGKLPVHLNRDVPGMIVNRVQHAMMREAFDLIDRGIATAEDIDLAVRFGYGFRYVACGPVKQRDLNGLVIHRAAAAEIYPTLHNGAKAPRCLTDLVRAGHTGVRNGRGFYRWPDKTARAEIARYEKLLESALRLMADDRRRAMRRKR